MKKLSQVERIRSVRLTHKRHYRTLRRKYCYFHGNNRRLNLSNKIKLLKTRYPNASLSYIKGHAELKAPEIMRLSHSSEEIMQFLQCIRSMVPLKAKRLSVDFTTIKDLSPLCAMLLASEVHRWQIVKRTKLTTVNSEKWTPAIRRLLHDMGLFNLVDVNNPLLLETTDTEEKFIRIRSGQLVDLEEAIGRIEQEVKKVALLLNSEPAMYGGIEEAITNVLQWGYKDIDEKSTMSELINRWWFFSSYNQKTGRMTIMVYDHGIGIPKTLPTYKWQEQVKKWLADKGVTDWTDEKIIQAGMQIPRSASGKDYRAKGLRKMKELLGRFERGVLFILSGKGEYRVDNNGNEKVTLHKQPIGGTLILWEVYSNRGSDA